MLLTEPGGGRGALFAAVFLQMDAVRFLPPSRDAPHGSLGLKAKSPKYPRKAVCCLPSHGHTCGGPARVLFVTVLALGASLSHSRECGDVLSPSGFPLPQGTDTQPSWGLSDTQNVMPLQRWQLWNWLKQINIPHHTSEMWPAEMLLFPVTGVSCGHSFSAAGWW